MAASRPGLVDWFLRQLVEGARPPSSPDGLPWGRTVVLRSIRTDCGKPGRSALTTTAQGLVTADVWGLASKSEKWDVEFLSEKTYFWVEEDHKGKAHLHAEGCHSEKAPCFVAIRSQLNQRYLSAKPGRSGKVAADAEKAGPWERWEVSFNRDGKSCTFKSAHGKYLCCDEGWFFGVGAGELVVADRAKAGRWEHWFVVISDYAHTNEKPPPRSEEVSDARGPRSWFNLRPMLLRMLGAKEDYSRRIRR